MMMPPLDQQTHLAQVQNNQNTINVQFPDQHKIERHLNESGQVGVEESQAEKIHEASPEDITKFE